MKVKIFSTLTAFCVLCLLLGCEKQIDEEPSPADCFVYSFLEGVSTHSRCGDECYLIKGMVQEHYEHGLNIRLVEDKKGNFPENTSTFTVWGAGFYGIKNRTDNILRYNKGDTLILHLVPIYKQEESCLLNPGLINERPGDFAVIPCTSSALILSNGYVTGHIVLFGGWSATMRYDEFKTEIEKLLTQNE